MASSPEGSPPSSSPSSTTDKSSSPPQSAPPPPKSSPPPEESKSPPPPSSSPPPPSSSPPPPSSTSTSPPPPPPSSSTSPPPPSSSSSSTPSSPSPSPPSPSSSSNNNDSNNNNNNQNATPSSSSPPPPPPPTTTTPRPNLTSENSSSTQTTSSPKLSPPPPPPKPQSSSNSVENGSSESSNTHATIVIGVSVGVCMLIILIIAFIIVSCNKKKKKKSDNFNNQPMQYYNNSTPGGGFGYANSPSPAPVGQMNNVGYQANDHHAIGLQPPPGVWPNTPSTQGQTPSSSDMSSNNLGQIVPSPYPSPLGFINQGTFTYEDLAIATYGFSQGNLLGQGGFGFVHKGVLSDGKEVAIKSLKSGSGQGQREFQAEVEIISRIHHRHLVSLVGYCIAGEKKLLVYEFVSNKTLEFHLQEKGRPTMDWPTRLKIALGAAKGLAYLHEDCHPRIIHRDIKSANILLDFSFEAMVADFGLAKLTEDNNTHVSTRVMGTFGYLAPEYASSGKLTDKSDVFSFGVVLLELITGRRPLDLKSDMDESLVDWARPLCASATEDKNFSQLVDPRLENNFVPHEMARMIACAAASIRHSARRRPKMRQIVRALEGDVPLDDLSEAMGPGQGRFGFTSDSNDYDSSAYSADMKNFRKLALESQGYSSNYGNTSEYGLNPSSSSSDESGPIGRR